MGKSPVRPHDIWWFVNRLKIQHREGHIVEMRKALQPDGTTGLTPEQKLFMRVFSETDKNILVLKPRQMGMTTIVMACLFWQAYNCPDPVGILSIMHEHMACKRVNSMLRGFIMGIVAPLRPGMDPDNSAQIGLSHNGAGFAQMMAGGRGQGRSFTFQIIHASEMGQWPRGSASTNKSSEGADADVWASADATAHDGPYRRTIVEFTGDGPSGKGYELVKIARQSDDWVFLFFRWFDFAGYAINPPPDWERTAEEQEQAQIIAHGLGVSIDDPQIDRKLAWRRRKIRDKGYSMQRFQREYPSTWEEPFLLAQSTWFDGVLVNKLVALLRLEWHRDNFQGPLRIYHEPEEARKYFVGGDTSGGTGGDMAVFVVIRDDFEVCAVWSSNTTLPAGQGDQGAKLSAKYNNAVNCTEENNYGLEVITRMEELGVRTWKDEREKNFWSQGGRAGQSKKKIYGHARELVDSQGCCSIAEGAALRGINDADILGEMIVVREDARGNIQAPAGLHDDYVDAYVLALWCGRDYYERRSRPVDPDKLKLRAIRRHMR